MAKGKTAENPLRDFSKQKRETLANKQELQQHCVQAKTWKHKCLSTRIKLWCVYTMEFCSYWLLVDIHPSSNPPYPALLCEAEALETSILLCHIILYYAVLSHSVMSSSLWAHGLTACQAFQSMGNLQARILEWVAMPSSRGSCQPRDWTQVSALQADSLLSEPPGKPVLYEALPTGRRRGSERKKGHIPSYCFLSLSVLALPEILTLARTTHSSWWFFQASQNQPLSCLLGDSNTP